MKYKLHTVEASNGWAVVEVEWTSRVVLVDDIPTEAEAQACMERLNKHTDRVVASFEQDRRKRFEAEVNTAEDDMLEFRRSLTSLLDPNAHL